MRIEVILDEGTDDASSTSTGTCRKVARAPTELGRSLASRPLTAALVFKGGERLMEDLLWILVIVGLVAATLAYARLCDNA